MTDEPRRPERDAYADVGQAMRLAIERFLSGAEGRTLTRDARVFLAVLHLVASYSRLADRVYVAQISELAQIVGDVDERHTRRSLQKLHKLGAIDWQPSRGAGRQSWVSLPSHAADRPLVNTVAVANPAASGLSADDRAAERAAQEERVRGLWDAVVAHVERATIHPEARKEFARLVRVLEEHGATPAQVEERAKAYKRHPTLGRVMLTLPALVKWWEALASPTVDLYALTESWVRNVGWRFDDVDLVDELRDRLRRGAITRDQALELLELGRELRREFSQPDADPIEDFADVADLARGSLEQARRRDVA